MLIMFETSFELIDTSIGEVALESSALLPEVVIFQMPTIPSQYQSMQVEKKLTRAKQTFTSFELATFAFEHKSITR